MKIIFDYNRTLFNPETGALFAGVPALLEKLSRKHELFLISRNEKGRKKNFETLGIKKHFAKVFFVDEKEAAFREIAGEPENTLVVGDRVREEIALGNRFGFITVWLQSGKFADELPRTKAEKPRHTIKSLEELEKIIKTHEA